MQVEKIDVQMLFFCANLLNFDVFTLDNWYDQIHTRMIAWQSIL